MAEDSTADRRQEQLKLLAALQERDRRARMAPLVYYDPHVGQKRVHAAGRRARIVICHPGNRWGKSYANAAEAVGRAYGYRVWEVPNLQLTEEGDYPPRSQVPPEYWYRRPDGVPIRIPNRGLVISGLSAQRGIGSTMWPKIEAFLPLAVRTHADYTVNRGPYQVPVRVQLPNGTEIMFGSGEQSPANFEAVDYDWVVADEPMPKAVWTPIWRGCTDHMAPVLFSCTPVGAHAPWLYRDFILSDMEDVLSVAGSIHENPYLSEEAVKDFLDHGGFTDEERMAREHGAWSFLTHRAFPEFEPSVHIVPTRVLDLGAATIGQACDPAHRRPFAIIWGAWFGDTLEIFDEWPRNRDHSKMRSSEMTVPDYARQFRVQEVNYRPHYRVLDPRFGAARPRIKGEVHTSIQEDFAAEGVYFDCRIEGTEREEIGIERIRQMLRYDRKAPISKWNSPKLRVQAHCINTINALFHSNFVPPSARDPDILPEKLHELYKDFRDALRYLILYPFIPASVGSRAHFYIDPDALLRENDESWF